jgi:hypothetical protein
MAEIRHFLRSNEKLTREPREKKNQIESKHPMDLISSTSA